MKINTNGNNKKDDWRYQDENQETVKENKAKLTKKIVVAVLIVFLFIYIAFMFYTYFLKDKIDFTMEKPESEEQIVTDEKSNRRPQHKDNIIEETQSVVEEEQVVITESETAKENEELWVTVSEEDMLKRGYEFLDAIEPVEISGDFYYYDPKDVKTLNHNCSGNHINITVEEFEEYITKALPGAKFSEGSTKTDNNYYINYDTSMQRVVFNTYYFVENLDQYSKGYSGDLSIDFYADTSTGQIHYIDFSFPAVDEHYKIFSEWINAFNSVDVSIESVAEAVTKAQRKEKGYPYYKCEGDFLIEYYVPGDYVMVRVYPIEQKEKFEKYCEIDE